MSDSEDFRSDGRFPALRTICHGCRQLAHAHVQNEDGTAKLRTLIIPGDGSVVREIAPGQLVTSPCPLCGDSEEMGWLPGFVTPA